MTTALEPISKLIETDREQHESYFQLVWQRFKKSKAAIAGGLMILVLLILALFAEFFSPNNYYKADFNDSYIPPSRVRFVDEGGNFHLRPFVYNQNVTVNLRTLEPIWEEDTSQRYELQFLVKSWEWKVLGLFPTRYHLFGVEEGGVIYLLGTEKQGRDLWGRSCLAGRISLSLGLIATFISIAVGSVRYSAVGCDGYLGIGGVGRQRAQYDIGINSSRVGNADVPVRDR